MARTVEEFVEERKRLKVSQGEIALRVSSPDKGQVTSSDVSAVERFAAAVTDEWYDAIRSIAEARLAQVEEPAVA